MSREQSGLSGADLRETVGPLGLAVPAVVSSNRFRPARIVGDLCFVSSMTPRRPDGSELRGCIGVDGSVELAIGAAEWCVGNSIASLAAELDTSMRRVIDAVDVVVYVNAIAGFEGQSDIADAASRILESIFPSSGGHARGAIGARSLVRNSVVVVKITYALAPSNRL